MVTPKLLPAVAETGAYDEGTNGRWADRERVSLGAGQIVLRKIDGFDGEVVRTSRGYPDRQDARV